MRTAASDPGDAATAWEYRVETIGSWIRSPKDPELAAALNDWGEEGWVLVNALARESSQAVTLILRRPLGRDERRRRTLPGEGW
jgi:hypothetical protein